MLDTAQIILLLVIVVLTTLLVVLGVQLFFILKEFKKTVSKANKVLDDAGIITGSVSSPMSFLSTLFGGAKTGASIVSVIKKNKRLIEKIIGKDDEDGKGK